MSNFNKLEDSIKPREKLLKLGANKLSDAELLAIILQTGSKNKSVINLSQDLIEGSGGLSNVFECSFSQLMDYKAIGEVKAIKLLVIRELINRIENESRVLKVQSINSPKDVYKFMKGKREEKQEFFWIILLDTKNKIITIKEIFKGTLNSVTVHPREIFKEAIYNSSDKIIMVHNHPSNSAEPSENDIEVTRRMHAVAGVVGIELIDHVIITKNNWYSIFENHQIF